MNTWLYYPVDLVNIGFLFGFENLIVTYIILYFMAYSARKILGHYHDGGRFSE